MPLHVYQSLWGMEGLPWNSEPEWSLDEKLDRVASSGFQGLSISFTDAKMAQHVAAGCVDRGLRIQASYFPTTVEELKPVFETVGKIGRQHVNHVNLQPNVRPMTVEESVPFVLGWQKLAADAGVPMFFETHRDRMTTDLLFTLQLLDAVPSMMLTADLSHYLVGREFALPVSSVNHELIHRVLDRARAFHGRVASREQVQVSTSFPHHKIWVDLFSEWWREGFRRFKAAMGDDAVLTFTPELGPPQWYAITDAHGNELSDRWDEALQLASLARRLWDEA